MEEYHLSRAPFGEGKASIFKNVVLSGIARKYYKTGARVILRFLVQSDIIVIAKSVRKERIIENMNLFDFSPRDEDVKTIEAMDKNESLFGRY